MTDPEFSRPVRIDRLSAEPRRIEIEADARELAALAERFALTGLDRLEAEAELRIAGEAVIARGSVRASLTQSCVASGEPVGGAIDEPFEIVFRPAPDGGSAEEEVELSEGEMDVVFHDGASLDLGEAVAQTLFLSLDPYPRSAAADEALKQAGVKSEEEAGPFAALAALRDKLTP